MYRYYSSIDNNVLGDMLGKAFINDWSDANAFNYYTGRNLKKIEVPPKIQEYFLVKDWDNACLEQQMIYDRDNIYMRILTIEGKSFKWVIAKLAKLVRNLDQKQG